MNNLIRHFRKLKGWSSETLADKAGTTPQQINLLENGKRKLTQDWMEKLAKALDLAHPALLLPGSEARHTEDLSDIEEQVIQVLRLLGHRDQESFFRFLKSFNDDLSITPHLQHIERLRGAEKKSAKPSPKVKGRAR